MRKVFVPLLLATVFSLVSCQNNTKSAQNGNGANAETSDKAAIPDQNDLLKVLQGRWQSEQDPTYVLEISDTQMTHTQNGTVVQQANLDVDGACQSPVCKPDGVDTSDGWCFTEMTIVEGKYHAECMFVTLCNANQLQYRPLGGAGNGLAFKKIP
ncbi:MAG TPA: hypothetical protein VK168_22065 [Saprospiraceae bacterium]|nr:hypothetical protein [Saprospiraceae bacterium]